MAETQSKTQMLENLKGMLKDVFKLRREGVTYARLARAHGYVDGYMRVLLESGMATRQGSLELVATERVRADGPGTGVVSLEDEVAA
jgi:hypothetical protein